MKVTLAVWLGAGVLSAGLLAYLPDLHAELHHHQGAGHQPHDHEQGPPVDGSADHQCLVQFISAGGLEQASPAADLIPGWVGCHGCQLVEQTSSLQSRSVLLPFGRAPPAV